MAESRRTKQVRRDGNGLGAGVRRARALRLLGVLALSLSGAWIGPVHSCRRLVGRANLRGDPGYGRLIVAIRNDWPGRPRTRSGPGRGRAVRPFRILAQRAEVTGL
jgi:hypothetical protein